MLSRHINETLPGGRVIRQGIEVEAGWEANEALDCRVYAYAVLHGLFSMGLNLNRRADALPPPLEHGEPEETETPAKSMAAPRRRLVIGSRYV